MSIAIYKIVCTVNNKVYIGQTTDYNKRIKNHMRELKGNRHSNKLLQEDFNRYGLTNFRFDIIEENINENDRLLRESYWMNYYGGTNSELIYNVKGNFKGEDNREYALKKVEAFQNKFDRFKNHTHTEQSKQKISESLKEAYRVGKHKLAGIVAGDCTGKNNAFYGKHHTEETRKMLSKQKTKYTTKFINELRDLYKSGLTFKNIAKKFNMPAQSVSKLIKYGTTSDKQIKLIKNKSVETNRDECNGVG